MKFCDFGNFGNLRVFAKFAKFCACYSAPCNTLFLHVWLFFLMSDIPSKEDALNELVVAPDDDAADAPAKKNPKLDYGAKTTLRLPLADPEFMGEWRKYCCIEGVAIANHGDLVLFWDKQTGVLAKPAPISGKSPNNVCRG